MNGALFRAEAAEGPDVVARQFAANASAVAELAAQLRAKPPPFVVTCARGSSDHAATYAKYLIESTIGIPVVSAAPSMSSVYRTPLRVSGALHLSISQSGRSPDLLASVEAAKTGGALTVSLVNDLSSPLAALADVVLPLHAGSEQSVAASKSCLAAFAALLQLAGAWSEEQVLADAVAAAPEALAEAKAMDWHAGLALAGADHLFVIGRGIGLSAAQELALKFKEMCGLHAEAFSAAEVLHGPATLAGPRHPVIALIQEDATVPALREVVARLRGQGAEVLTVEPDGQLSLPALPIAVLRPLQALQASYRLLADLAEARGVDPDAPPHLRKVTQTT